MSKLTIATGVAAALLLGAASAQAAESQKSKAAHVAGKVHARAHAKAEPGSGFTWGSYRDMRGFDHTPHSSGFEAFASAPGSEPPSAKTPTISSFPMPYAVWW
jgi:hypothetical protein